MNLTATVLILIISILTNENLTSAKNISITLTSCEWHTMHVQCEDGDLIKIITGNYGRTSKHICSDGKDTLNWNLKCESDNTLETLQTRCDNKKSCVIDAKNEIFGDPCPGTEKYLDVTYECFNAPNMKYNVACEHKSMELKCPPGDSIEIIAANYGRTDETICSRNQKNLNCVSQQTVEILSDRCHSQNECIVEAENEIYGDPCVGIEKYLEVTYKCIATARANKIHTTRACESNDLNIRCPQGELISIQYAMYGRNARNYCHGTAEYNVNCGAMNSLSMVSTRCDMKQNCIVPVRNTVFGDPCRGTVKYLEVQYTCESHPTHKTAIACEHEKIHLECDDNSFIIIADANYGRSNYQYCSKDQSTNNWNLNCFATTSKNIIAKKCNFEKHCIVEASNKIFGDPCSGTIKYLEVQYECGGGPGSIDVRIE